MTSDSHLFKTQPGPGRLPLYEGKMIWQFDSHYAEPRYWVDEKEARKAVLGRTPDTSQRLDYQEYRLGFRDIASNTNERTLISSIIPPSFHGNKIPTVITHDDSGKNKISINEKLFLCGVWNSLILDHFIRQRVTTTLNFFYIYQLPVPRFQESNEIHRKVVQNSARLICISPEFNELAKSVGLGGYQAGAIDPKERVRLRAELDAIVAHLYSLTEVEFAHVLSTFPIVKEEVKQAVMKEFLKSGSA